MAIQRRKRMKFTGRMKKKLFIIVGIVIVLLVILSIRMIRINLKDGKKYSKAVYDNFNYDSKIVAARRGDITDRNGTVLAYSSRVYNLILDAKILLSDENYKQPTMEAILKYLPVDRAELETFVSENEAAKKAGKTVSSYKRLATKLSVDTVAPVKELLEESPGNNICGIWFEEEYERIYPYNTVACDVLGFASDNNGGEIGLENYYDKELSGTDGRVFGYMDNASYETNRKNPINGNTLVTTLDYSVQTIIEEAILEFNREYGSKSTSVIAMDPNNGEILGMADYPVFDLNNPRDISHIYSEKDLRGLTEEELVQKYYDIWRNYCVSSIYEPGSVFKTFTVAEAVEEKIETQDDTFLCDGYAVYNNSKITCHGGVGHGYLTLAGTLDMSCNDALMKIGEDLGVDIFTNYFKVFKLGMKTGIDLPSEEAGLVRDKSEMMDVDLVTNAFGQNLNVTMAQMVSIFASIINGGNYYKPHLVKEIKTETGDVVKEVQPELVTQTISEDTSKLMRSMLRTVVDYGTAGYVHFNNYSVGGKTGTAEKVGREDDEYVVSFMGFAPAENPQILLYVVIDAPDCEDYASSWSAQMVFRKIFQRLLPYLGIPANDPDYEMNICVDATDLSVYAVKRPSDPMGEIPPLVPSDANPGAINGNRNDNEGEGSHGEGQAEEGTEPEPGDNEGTDSGGTENADPGGTENTDSGSTE